MDPELAKLLTTLGVALVGVGGTALGAWLNQRGARTTAERTLAGQRVLARDAARREWLVSASRQFLDAFPERQVAYNQVINAVVVGNLEAAQHTLRDLHTAKDHLAFTATLGLDESGLGSAFRAYLEADGVLLVAARDLIRALEDGVEGDQLRQLTLTLDQPAHRAGVAFNELRRVLVQLIFSDPT